MARNGPQQRGQGKDVIAETAGTNLIPNDQFRVRLLCKITPATGQHSRTLMINEELDTSNAARKLLLALAKWVVRKELEEGERGDMNTDLINHFSRLIGVVENGSKPVQENANIGKNNIHAYGQPEFRHLLLLKKR